MALSSAATSPPAEDPDTERELRVWNVGTTAAFHQRAIAAIVDHGVGLPIFRCTG
jgi:hypothetical protein